MTELSSGTITFLFTDLEGSTRLWEHHPDAMRTALAHHDGLMREAVEAHRGRVVKSTGDGAMATFPTALDGIDAAVTAQTALYTASWPDGVELRVRMGVHTGVATERDGDWFGSDVNRAARVMAAAHGRQVVCTGVVAEQVRDEVELLDLGEHRLRDLQAAVHIFQVVVPGGPVTFPPLRSLDAYRSNLPYELSSFVGRDHEVRSLIDRMRSSRVVSIVGVGGVGKTRLALQVGSELLPRFADGVWLCELAPVLDPDDLPDAVAAAVGYAAPQGVPVAEGLPRYLERKGLLLILDNCEHLVAAAAEFVRAITAHAPHVSVLTTSRESLGVEGERVFSLASLGLPTEADAVSVSVSEAGALFVARAEDACGEFTVDASNAVAVHDLCVRLDGIPLAIELAAARTTMMTPGEILGRLDQQFRVLTGGRRTSLERHQTLRAAIDWSYDLLTDAERALLERLSVCVGGFDLDAAVALAVGAGSDEFDAFDLVASLVAKSLVEHNERDGVTRYRLLEMIRQYAAEQLTASGAARAEAARDDHARHYLAVAHALVAEVMTPSGFDALDRLETETPNVAAAGRWLLEAGRVAELLAFFDALPYIDNWTLAPTTVDELGAIALEAVTLPGTSTLAGFPDACYSAAVRAFFDGDLDEFERLVEHATQFPGADAYAQTHLGLSTVAMLRGDLETSLALGDAAVAAARAAGDPALLAFALSYVAGNLVLLTRGQAAAQRDAEEALAVARAAHSDVASLYPLSSLANAAWMSDPARTVDAADECHRLDRTRRRTWANNCRTAAGLARIMQGEVHDGLEIVREALLRMHDNGERFFLAGYLANLAEALAHVDPSIAIELGAIAEGGVIAPTPVFNVLPALTTLARERAADVEAARARAAIMTYEAAANHVFDTIDRLVAEHEPREAAG